MLVHADHAWKDRLAFQIDHLRIRRKSIAQHRALHVRDLAVVDIDPHPLPRRSARAVNQTHIVQHNYRSAFFDIGLEWIWRGRLRETGTGKNKESCNYFAGNLHGMASD